MIQSWNETKLTAAERNNEKYFISVCLHIHDFIFQSHNFGLYRSKGSKWNPLSRQVRGLSADVGKKKTRQRQKELKHKLSEITPPHVNGEKAKRAAL